MALTRRLLKGMNLTEEQVDSIIDAHTETVNGLKDQMEAYKADAEKLPAVQQELNQLKAAGDGGWQEKYNTLSSEYDAYKADVEAKATKAAKERAARAYYESKGITGKALDIAVRGSHDEIEALELDGDAIKDTAALDALISGTFSGLVTTTETRGASTATPPSGTGIGGIMTKADIYKKDDHGRYLLSAAERQQALIETHQQTT